MIDYYEAKSQPITRLMVWQAYKKVKANKGSSGKDAMSWAYLDKHAKTLLYKLWNRLSSGSYFPMPVRQVEIAKSDGGVRQLGIPTLLDRIAQEVAKHHLEKQVEPLFHNSSFGYRPKRSCHDAVAQAERNSFNHDFVIDLDIKGFFDNIDHELMMKALQHYCKDRWVLLYAQRWLKAGVMSKDGNVLPSEAGTPQGGVISPLLANVFLHAAFDKWMEKEHPGKPFERYADDIVVHCKTEKQAKYVLAMITRRLNACKLTLHPVKTKIVNLRGTAEKKYPKGYDFLGFTIRPSFSQIKGKNLLMPATFISTKSKKRVLEKFKSMSIHKRRRPLKEVAALLTPVIRGIINYYHKFWDGHMHKVWYQLNQRLLKWVKWEKGLYEHAAIKWLKQRYKETPHLFPHWRFVHP
ncbi:group II intron reverse transcriptase/maturase [Flavihumibacter sp. UBA7668]|uniref:group II intron reverse transcriptase/maturase n=1 Tax=Flavihumibacter sp. UBA7668 TaxID=1946542 RepID=UPI0025B862DB|nr:group II intron reverse transcriptase/maturase [Flavihumibacter sp. UBA7668]